MRKQLKVALFLGLGTGFLGVAATLVPPVLELEESIGLQRLFALRGPVPAPDDVVIVGIARESAEAMDLPADLSAWPRSLHAELLTKLAAAGASVVAFDILFEEPRDRDGRFADAIGESRSVVLLDRMQRQVTAPAAPSEAGAHGLIREQRSRPLGAFLEAAVASVPFPLPVVPITTSQFWVFLPSAADAPTLPVAALQLHALDALQPFVELIVEIDPDLAGRLPPCENVAALRTGQRLEAFMRAVRQVFLDNPELGPRLLERLDGRSAGSTDAATRRLIRALITAYGGPSARYINYFGPPRSVRTVPYHRALAELDRAAEQWRGKAVFVGFSEQTQPEQQDTFYSVFSQRSGLNLSGVEIAATAFANLLDARPVTPLTIPQSLFAVLAWGVLLGLGLGLASTGAAIAAALVAAPAYAGFALHEFGASGVWWPLVVPLFLQLPAGLFGSLWWSYARAHRRGERLRQATSRYLPAALVRRMQDEPEHAAGRYEVAQAACLVTDAEQYTALSESMRPEQLAELLNDYYEVLFRIVRSHGGQVTDLVGDSMVAVWPAEGGRDLRAEACRAAIDIMSEQSLAGGTGHLLPTRVGLHAGELLLGTIGAAEHLEYRAVGDTVNSASRVQELNKRLGTRVLVSDAALPEDARLASRDLGTFMLAGKQAPLRIHELLASAREAASSAAGLLEEFAAALAAYRSGDLERAAAAFRGLLEKHPDDGPSRFYLALCERQAARPADVPWDPVVRMLGK